MIDRIVVGRGSNRNSIPMERGRDPRRSVAGALKQHLFPTNRAYCFAKRRGAAAFAVL